MSIPNVEVSEDLFRKSYSNGENASNEASDNSENEIEETNSTANEELKEESKGEIAVVSSGKIKTVEDKALQAILADRRRSIEEGRTSGDAAKYQKRSRKGGRSEDESSMKNRSRTTIVALHLNRELQQKRRQMGSINEGVGIQEVYTDKDRAAAVTLGDQDIKTSLRVQQKSERRVVYPDEMDSNVYITEAQRNLTIGNLETAYNCAKKAVDNGGQDPQSLLVRSRCCLSIGKLENALSDAQEAFEKDPTLIQALLVQAEALYAMGEFERALVLYHRGNRKRPYLASFRKGIQKSREAILNAIGGGKFPEVTGKSGFTPLCVNKSTSASAGGSPEITAENRIIKPEKVSRERVSSVGGTKKSKFGGVKPLVTEIKTSKMVSKKLLGGLSSDKEFLSNLLSRDDLVTPKLRLPLEHSKQGRRKTAHNNKNNENQGNEIINDAKEALTSLQYLEAFMWQRDPSGLTMQTKENYLNSRRNTKRKKKKFPKRKIVETNSCLASDVVNEQETTQREIHIKENVASLLSRLDEHSGTNKRGNSA